MKKIFLIVSILFLINFEVYSSWLLTLDDFKTQVSKYNSNNTYFCQDWTKNCLEKSWISLEKALEVLFINSWIYWTKDNNQIMNLISLWEINKDLSKDVSPKNLDGSVNYYYWFIKKALEINYSEIDIYWEEKKYFLVKLDSNGNLNTKKYLTTEEFENILYIFKKLKPSLNIDTLEKEIILNNLEENIDTDWDGVFDNLDKCLIISWDKNNFGCPILNKKCLKNSEINTCKSWYICSEKWFCEVDNTKKNECIYPQNGSSIFWNVICNSCPCDYKIDFLSTLRKCDIVLPAIVSPDWSEIYSKWTPYQIPYE